METGTTQAFDRLDHLEAAYLEARIFRSLLVPRLLALLAAGAALVALLRLPWTPFEVMVLLAGTPLVLVMRAEARARREWDTCAAAMRPAPRTGTRPMAP